MPRFDIIVPAERRPRCACSSLAFACWVRPRCSFAQALSIDHLGLVGDRFAALKFEAMTPEQRTMVEHLLSGERHRMGGPFNVLLRSPEMGDAAQQYGAQARFHAGPSEASGRNTGTILRGRYWTAQYEWNAHKAAALRAGSIPPSRTPSRLECVPRR